MVWLKAEIHFGTSFSYRQPDASAQYAIGSPLPSPAAIKLALVDTAIRWRGDVRYGQRVFNWLKTCTVHAVPPEKVVRFRVFLKRMKPEEFRICPNHPDYRQSAKEKKKPCPECGHEPIKIKELSVSFGTRDYFLMNGPMNLFLQVPDSRADQLVDLLKRVRKLGTSDSLCWCEEVEIADEREVAHYQQWFPVRLSQAPKGSLLRGLALRFTVARLSDLSASSEFDQFNPFAGGRRPTLNKEPYLLPLRAENSGETWTILRRASLREILEG